MELQGLGSSAADYGRRSYDWCREFLSLVPKATGGKVMPILLGFFASTVGRWLVIGGMVLSVFFGCARHYENKGEAKVLRASKEEGAKANATNEQIRSAAERDGAAERVRNKFCRDC